MTKLRILQVIIHDIKDVLSDKPTVRRDRDNTIDVLKGTGIILMVLRHARMPYSDFVLLFHMPLFFMASGYLYKGRCESFTQLKKYVLRKIKSLWIPYFVASSFFVVLNNAFLFFNVYTDNELLLRQEGLEYVALAEYYGMERIIKEIIKSLFFMENTQLGGALWFFRSLFVVVVGYGTIDFLIGLFNLQDRRAQLQGGVSLISLLIGYFLSIKEITIGGLSNVFTVYCLVFIGDMLKKKDLMKKGTDGVKGAVGMFFSLILLIIGYETGYNISIVDNKTGNPLCFLIMSLSGWMLIFIISKFVVEHVGRGYRYISYISIDSVWIIALHFLSFKIVSYIGICIQNKPDYLLAAFPVLYRNSCWWIAYTLSGIAVPLMAGRLLNCIHCMMGRMLSRGIR